MGYRPLISTLRMVALAMLAAAAFATPSASAAGPPADIAVGVTASDSVTAGTNLDYTIVVTNKGPNAADVTLADTLPSGTTFNSLAVGGGFTCTTPPGGAAGTVSCSKASVAAGGSATFTLSVHVSSAQPDGSALSNTATVGTSATDSNGNNDSSTATTTVFTDADLGITKSASPDTVTPGGTITYTIDVSNSGPSDAVNVKWTDTLPADVTFVSESQDSGPTFTCTDPAIGSGGKVSCTIASLASGSTASFTVTVLVSATPSGAIENTASVSSSTPDYSEASNNSSTVITSVQTASDLAITKTDSPDPVQAGSTITYTITVTNNGPEDVGNVVVSDDVPAGTTFSAVTIPAKCDTPEAGSGGTIECNLGSIASSGSVVFKLEVNVSLDQENGTTISNTATVGSSTNTDAMKDNDSATATTAVQASADLVLTNADSPDPVHAGDELTYTIGIANNGPASAHGVTLADTLPSGTTFVSLSTPAGFDCSTPAVGANGTVTCSGGTVDLGGVSFELVVKVLPSVAPATVLSNTATTSASTPEAAPGNEGATATTTVNTSADLAVSKKGSPDAVVPGGEVSYTIDLTNNGPSDAANVSMTDPLPASTTFKSLDAPPGFTCTTGATVTCTATGLTAGTTATFTLVVQVSGSAPAGSTISNTAGASTDTADPKGPNNSSTATTTVKPTADLALTKSDSPDPVTAGSNLTYTIGLSNNGPSPASDVNLSDDVPSGTGFVSMSAAAGFSCTTPAAGAGGKVTCSSSSMASGASGSFTLVVHVAPSLPSGTTLSNTATVSATESDPNPGNESATSSTTVSTSADLSTSVSDSADPVAAGDVVTYHVRLHNGGPSDSAQPRLAMPIPSGTTLVGAAQTDGSAFHCSSDGATVACAADSLAADAGAAIDVAVRTAGDQHGTITARPVASEATSDPDSSNDASSETTEVTAAPRPNRLTIGRTIAKRRSGVIVVALGCKSFDSDRCRTTLTLRFRSPHQDLQSITTRATVKSGERKNVYVIGPRPERRRIKRIQRLPVTVTATNPPGPDVARDATIVGTSR
jgi:uncharacterized repeat protein (TIGR01451 family)